MTSRLLTDGCTSCELPTGRLIDEPNIRFSEIISAMSIALDLTQGHSQGHCMRSALIGMRVADVVGIEPVERSALFYALLLKDLGCSSNAAKLAYLYQSDDHSLKRSARLIDWTKSGECLKHCWSNCAVGESTISKLMTVASVLRAGLSQGRQIATIRCERGAEIAQMLQLPKLTSRAIYDLDEHWDGSGNPAGLKGEKISFLGRICCLAQTVEVFFTESGLASAIDVAQSRRKRWFDPTLVDALMTFKSDRPFWERLRNANPMVELSRWEPADEMIVANEECLDLVAQAFARVVDAKSPWTYQHSTQVAEIATKVARQFDCPPDLLRDIKRAALLHDIGKLGVSNKILDKPGKPTEEEFAQIRKHPDYTQQILSRVNAFTRLADVAGAHHERLDGRGYHQRLADQEIPWAARVLAVADICEAMSAARPYRKGMSWDQIHTIMSKEVGTGIDASCFAALEAVQANDPLESRVELQLDRLEHHLSSASDLAS